MTDEEQVLCSHVHYSTKFSYLYVDTPKVGCSTIKQTLQSAESVKGTAADRESRTNSFGYTDFLLKIHDRTQSDLKWAQTSDELHELFRNARLTFCFSRNPYSRVLSAYLDKIARNENRRAAFLKELDVENPETPREITFIEFLELVCEQPIKSMNAHWRPQYYHIMPTRLGYDFIGAFERMSEDLDIIIKRIDSKIMEHLTVVDEHKTGSVDLLQEYYKDDTAVRLVREIYRRDFADFRYSEDLSRAKEPPQQ